jgi:hypothetical protein
VACSRPDDPADAWRAELCAHALPRTEAGEGSPWRPHFLRDAEAQQAGKEEVEDKQERRPRG